jgi:glutamyl endopeptidase
MADVAENHVPMNSPERPAAAIGGPELEAFEPTSEVLVLPRAELAPPVREEIVLPDYRSPRMLRAARDEARLEALDPTRPVGEPRPIAMPARDVAEGSFGETTLLEAVIGNDDRLRVDDGLTRSNPWRQICSLRILAASGTVYIGTGWFIGPKTLATAGHCVYIRNEGGWAASIDVVPGRYGATEPYGRATGTRFSAVDGWVKSGRRDFDYGVIHLPDATLGSMVGNFEVDVYPNAELVGVTSRISGYPADLDHGEYQYYHERPLLSVTATRLNYDIDTFGGQSGSPIWRQDAGSPPIGIGIHTTGGVTSNSGTRISEHVIENLIKWLGEA